MRVAVLTLLLIALACPTKVDAQGTVYAFDMRTRDNFLTFPADDPASLSFIDKNTSPFAMDFNLAGDTLYAVDSNTASIGTLDTFTGEYTQMVTITGDYGGGIIGGLSVDPTDNTYYMSTASTLYTVDINTGVSTTVGTFTDGGLSIGTIIDIAFDSAGNLFAHELDPDNGNGIVEGGLWSVNKTNAQSTFVGTSGLEAVFAQGMDFDPDTNVLYAAIYTGGGTGSYGTWDTTNGDFTEIVDLPSFGAVEFEMAISGGVTHAYDFRGTPDSFFTFDVDNPLPVTSEEPVVTYATFAMDFDDTGTLVIYDNGSNAFGTIDLSNGCFTETAALSGDLTEDPTGMSFNPATGEWWIVDIDGTTSEVILYLADPLGSGNTTQMSVVRDDTGFPINQVIDLAFDNDGNLYVYDIETDALYETDPNTGVATLVGFSNQSANFAQGMDFDPTTNILYQAIYTGGGTGSYGQWDLNSGAFTEILDLEAFPDPVGGGYELEIAITEAVLLGDINCDGAVDLLDVGPFVDLLTSGGFSPKADFDGDGAVTLLDVTPFVAVLTGG